MAAPQRARPMAAVPVGRRLCICRARSTASRAVITEIFAVPSSVTARMTQSGFGCDVAALSR